mmetsp:Transcript_108557/g.350310  ORF Transcript_108557/g.350310 Transcript_108557/m.350310 type:complete len:178 (-) Transcript_108557:32-565(-)
MKRAGSGIFLKGTSNTGTKTVPAATVCSAVGALSPKENRCTELLRAGSRSAPWRRPPGATARPQQRGEGGTDAADEEEAEAQPPTQAGPPRCQKSGRAKDPPRHSTALQRRRCPCIAPRLLPPGKPRPPRALRPLGEGPADASATAAAAEARASTDRARSHMRQRTQHAKAPMFLEK